MRKSRCKFIMLPALACFLGLSNGWGQTIDPQVYVCQSCTASPGGDPNVITNTGAFNVGFDGSHTSVAPLLIIVGVLNSTTIPTVSFNGTNHSPGGTAVWAMNSSAAAGTGVTMNTSGQDAYNLLGIADPNGGNSELFQNWTSGDVKNGITPASFSYTLYVYELPTTITGPNIATMIDESGATTGSYIIAYTCLVTTTSDAACTDGNVGSTPFTNSGLVGVPVPEPATMTLLGSGLLGLAGLVRRRRSKTS